MAMATNGITAKELRNTDETPPGIAGALQNQRYAANDNLRIMRIRCVACAVVVAQRCGTKATA